MGSGLRTGEWTSSAGWQEVADTPCEIPACLPQIPAEAISKARTKALPQTLLASLLCYMQLLRWAILQR